MTTETIETDNLYRDFSIERKEQQRLGVLPPWFTTGGWTMFKTKYLYNAKSYKEQIERIAKTAAKHTDDPAHWEPKFFSLFWNNWLSPSTPVLSNMGTDRGLPVSCSGQFIDDSVSGFYEGILEAAVLSKHGFGTSAYLGAIRPRGSKVGTGGKASGILPVLDSFVDMASKVNQGSRRGAWAGYIPIEHGDFWEVIGYLEEHPDDVNIGWTISDAFIAKLKAGDEEANKRWKQTLKVKMTFGKGYYHFTDKVNRHRPDVYKDKGLLVYASNLCDEIQLHSSPEYTYTCVLSSMNVALWDEWKETDAVFVATVFLDCVASEFIERAKNIKHLDKAVAFTEKGRALGLGQMGLFSLFQRKGIDPESYQAHGLNTQIAKHIKTQADDASQWMAIKWGEPEWCKGYAFRNTHRIALPPTKSTALLMGGWSEGINPETAMAFTSSGAAGDIDRISPVFLEVMKAKGQFNKKTIDSILANSGSIQHLNWLDAEEKKVFKTAFEINQETLIRMASSRQRFVDQGQSLNLFFAHNDAPEYISKIHQMAFEDEHILGLYYVYSSSELKAERTECEACQ